MFRVFPHNMGSASATSLARALDGRKVYPDRNYRPRRRHTVINWGCNRTPNWIPELQSSGARLINRMQAVNIAQDKLLTFNRLRDEGVNTPEFTTSRVVAEEWLGNLDRVYCRTLLRGSEGRGIVTVSQDTGDRDYEFMEHELVDAPLYVLGIRGVRTEYRVHVLNGEAIAVSRKRRLTSESLEERGVESRGTFIRNTANGYIYSRETLEDTERLHSVPIQAVNALGLDFGAVDIISHIISHGDDRVDVLEINTAPGIEGETLDAYVNGFRRMANV